MYSHNSIRSKARVAQISRFFDFESEVRGIVSSKNLMKFVIPALIYDSKTMTWRFDVFLRFYDLSDSSNGEISVFFNCDSTCDWTDIQASLHNS